MASDAAARELAPRNPLARLLVAQPGELPAVLVGMLLFFLLFASWFMLRPVRETFGIAGGVENLQWLFTGTFVGTLVAVPLYGWAATRVPRRRLVPVTYLFCAAVMGVFALSLSRDPGNVWVARAFYIWASVFNLFVISIAWSLLADVFRPDQAHRLFAQMAAGASAGGLAGPILSTLLVAHVGHAGLLLISTGLLLATLACVAWLLRWPGGRQQGEDRPPDARPIGGGVWEGLTLILRSPYLLAIAGFVMLLTAVTTFLYFAQATIVEQTFPDPVRQTQVFGMIDIAVQSLTIGVQLFLTGRIVRRMGVTVLLAGVPLLMILAFFALAAAPVFAVLAAAMIARRVGEYAFVRPSREMLFARVGEAERYKAKNAIDTVFYRGGDTLSAWLNAAILAAGSLAAAALVGAAVSALWAALGWFIGRRDDRQAYGAPPGPASEPVRV